MRSRLGKLSGWRYLAMLGAIAAILVVSLILQSLGVAGAAWVALASVVVLAMLATRL
jgi:hypothetical protein